MKLILSIYLVLSVSVSAYAEAKSPFHIFCKASIARIASSPQVSDIRQFIHEGENRFSDYLKQRYKLVELPNGEAVSSSKAEFLHCSMCTAATEYLLVILEDAFRNTEWMPRITKSPLSENQHHIYLISPRFFGPRKSLIIDPTIFQYVSLAALPKKLNAFPKIFVGTKLEAISLVRKFATEFQAQNEMEFDLWAKHYSQTIPFSIGAENRQQSRFFSRRDRLRRNF